VPRQRTIAGGQAASGGDGAQWQRHPRHRPGARSKPHDSDDHAQKKAAALHQVNPVLVRDGEGADPAVRIRKVAEAEVDEMWSFVGDKRQPRWLWQALDHQTGRVVAYVFGRREDKAFLRLKRLLAPLGIRRFYTDGWGAYRRHLNPHQHVV